VLFFTPLHELTTEEALRNAPRHIVSFDAMAEVMEDEMKVGKSQVVKNSGLV